VGYEIPDMRCEIRGDMRDSVWDAGQIVEDLIPNSRQDGGVLTGDMRCKRIGKRGQSDELVYND
jgi:hypothetical protein